MEVRMAGCIREYNQSILSRDSHLDLWGMGHLPVEMQPASASGTNQCIPGLDDLVFLEMQGQHRPDGVCCSIICCWWRSDPWEYHFSSRRFLRLVQCHNYCRTRSVHVYRAPFEVRDIPAYHLAVSMWRYPAWSAVSTASSCASSSCQVPNPMAGIWAPVLSLKCFCSKDILWLIWFQCVKIVTYATRRWSNVDDIIRL